MANFVEILRYLDDVGLDAYQTRLLLHYWRVGVCWESVETTAAKCKMSMGKVSQTRKWLLEKGYIKWQPKGDKVGISISFNPSPHEEVQQEYVADLHHMNEYIHVVNEHIHHMKQSIPNEDNLLSLPTEETPPEKSKDSYPAKEGGWYELQAAVCVVTKKQPAMMKPFELEDIDRLFDSGYTAAQIKTAYQKGKPNYWSSHWKTKGRFRVPTIQEILDTIGEAVEWQPGQAAVNGSSANGYEAESAWSLVLDHINKGSGNGLKQHERTWAAISELGGWTRFKTIDESDIPWRKKEFIKAYGNTATAQH